MLNILFFLCLPPATKKEEARKKAQPPPKPLRLLDEASGLVTEELPKEKDPSYGLDPKGGIHLFQYLCLECTVRKFLAHPFTPRGGGTPVVVILRQKLVVPRCRGPNGRSRVQKMFNV